MEWEGLEGSGVEHEVGCYCDLIVNANVWIIFWIAIVLQHLVGLPELEDLVSGRSFPWHAKIVWWTIC